MRSHVPYLSFTGEPSNKALGHNQFGFRGPDPSTSAEDEFRIFVFGGSTVWNGDPPLPELWSKIARRNGYSKVVFYNFGVVSSVARQDVARAFLEGFRFDPHMLVMYNGGNDVISPVWQDPRPGYPYDYYVWEANPFLSESPGPGNFFRSIIANSHIGRYLLQNESVKFIAFGLFGLREEVGYLSSQWMKNIARNYLDSQKFVQETATRMGITALTIFHPVRAYGIDSRYPVIEQTRREIIKLQKEEYSTLNFLDLSLMFSNSDSELAYTDIIHVTKAARERVAEISFPFIERHLPENLR